MKKIFNSAALIIGVLLINCTQPVDAQRKIVSGISSGKYTEFAPTISANGKTIIFESNREKTWKLYESHLDNKGKWSEPFPLSTINEKLSFLAGPDLSYDGNTLFFTGFIDDVSTSEDIFYSQRLDDKTWSEPKNIGAPVNTDGYEGFPSISADGHSLYFIRMSEESVFDKKNNEGCFTIFVSEKKNDGTWSVPEKLPAPLNSGCERDPRIMADNRTLILSSIRPGGKGKYDLYQTRKQNDGTWSALVPLDFVNSEENDQSPCISASGEMLYFYSDDDIYSIPIPQEYRQMVNVTLHGSVRDDATGEPIMADIIVRNVTTGNTFESHSNHNDGAYNVVLSAGSQYSIQFSNDFHVSETYDVDLINQDKYTEIEKDIRMKSDYKLAITVQDKDFANKISSFIQVIDQNGNSILKDSLHAEQYPYLLTLTAGRNYSIVASANQYASFTQAWQFDALKIRQKNTQIISLEHLKTELFTDVVGVTSHQRIKAKVFFNNENSDEVVIVDAGETVTLRKGDRYQVTTSSDAGYLFNNTTIVAGDDGDLSETGQRNLTLKAMPIEAGAQLTLEHISFALNSSDLNASSYTTLNRVAELLKKNPNVSVEISAHTDDLGDDAYNLRLSERRALSIVRYLNKNGVEIQRMRPHGHGKQKPLVPNISEENRAKNRRVELQILRAK